MLPDLRASLVQEPDLFALLHVLGELQGEVFLHQVVGFSGVRQVPGILRCKILDPSLPVVVPQCAWIHGEAFFQTKLFGNDTASLSQSFGAPLKQALLGDKLVHLFWLQLLLLADLLLFSFVVAALLPPDADSSGCFGIDV